MEKSSPGRFGFTRLRRHSLAVYPSRVIQKARRRIANLSEAGTSGEYQFSDSRKVQYLSALAANMGALAFGVVLSWTAVALPDLRRDPLIGPTLTPTQESWISSIVSLAAVASTPVAGVALEKIGRRLTMLLLLIPCFLGWLIIFFATNITMINIGRFFTGFCGGTFAVTAPIFLAEIADVKIRGVMGAGFDLMICVGQLLIYILGTFLSWRVYTFISALIPALIFIMMFFVPESPLYLVGKGDDAGAVLSLMRLRGASSPVQIERELNELRMSNERSKEEGTSFRDFFTPQILHPVSISFILFMLQVLSGIDPVLFFTVDIFQSAGTDIDEYLSTIYVGAVQVIGAIVAALLCDRTGRKILLLLSELFMTLSLCTLSLYFYLKSSNGGISPSGLGWLPLTSLVVFVFSYAVGIGPISYLLLGELIPQKVRGLASCILTSVKWMITFILVKFFGDIGAALGQEGAFFLFAGFCFSGLLYILFNVPETKGKTLDEIQRGFAPTGSFETQKLLARKTGRQSYTSL